MPPCHEMEGIASPLTVLTVLRWCTKGCVRQIAAVVSGDYSHEFRKGARRSASCASGTFCICGHAAHSSVHARECARCTCQAWPGRCPEITRAPRAGEPR